MSEPLVVVIPHRLGKAEALARIRGGIGRARPNSRASSPSRRRRGRNSRLTFRAAALGQRASGFIDVGDAAVRLEVRLPWLLARFAQGIQRVVGYQGQLMLEKK